MQNNIYVKTSPDFSEQKVMGTFMGMLGFDFLFLS
jgi:hypothetical protein